MDWVVLFLDRDTSRTVVNAVMNVRVPQHGGNSLTSYGPVSFSRKDSAAWSSILGLLACILLISFIPAEEQLCDLLKATSPLSPMQ